MTFRSTEIPGVMIVEPHVFTDDRGFFIETWHAERFAQAGICGAFVQDNHSGSRGGTLRGLHYQVDRPQGKLVRAVVGEIYDVAVDLRRSSPTFGRWVAETLSATNRRAMWVPPGFAHGFYAVSEHAEVVYKCTALYAPSLERTLAWNDVQLAIRWPVPDGRSPIVSAKDAAGTSLAAAELYP